MTRIVTLGNGRRVSLTSYVEAWKAAKTMSPDTVLPHGLRGWSPVTVGECLAEFRDGLEERINIRGGIKFTGRKHDSDWQRATTHAARELNTPRLRIHWLPSWLRERFAHRIADRSEY